MEYTPLDCRNIDICAGPCSPDTCKPMLEYDSKAKRNTLHTFAYPGHTTKVALKNAYLCKGCENRYDEFWDILEWGLECNASSDIEDAQNWFEQDANTVLRKFTKLTRGGVHYLTSEGSEEC